MPSIPEITEEEKRMILEYFYTHHENDDKTISKKLNLPYGSVVFTITNHLNKIKKKINNRNYNDIDWGDL